jgi:hypothetical protein
MEDWYLVGKIYYMLQQYHSTISIFVRHHLIEKSPLARYLAAKCAVSIIDYIGGCRMRKMMNDDIRLREKIGKEDWNFWAMRLVRLTTL